MKQALKLLCYVMLCYGLSACSVALEDKNTSDTPAKMEKTSRGLLLGELEQELRGLDKPNQYEYSIQWPAFTGELRISESGKLLAIVPGEQGHFIVENVIGGSRLRFLYEQIVEGKIVAHFLAPVVVPRDFELNAISYLSKDETIQAARVFLGPGAVVYTREHSLNIQTNELVSDGATLQNFLETDRVEEREKNGRSGGQIKIVAEKARGQLNVELSGEPAGNGRDGVKLRAMGHKGCWGSNGGNGGDAGQFILDVVEDSQFRYHVKNRPGSGGIAGIRGGAFLETSRSVSVFPCYSKVPGVNGSPGKAGRICTKRGSDKELVCLDL